MFPRHAPPMQWAPRSYVAPAAVLSQGGTPPLHPRQESQRGTPPLHPGQESQWFRPSGLPVQSYQQFHGRHQVPPSPTGYPVAHVSPGAPTPIDSRKRVVLGRYAVPQVSRQVPQTASTSMQPRTGNEIQEIRKFMGVMQQHKHNMQVPHRSQTERPTYQSQNSGYSTERRDNILESQNRLSSVVNPQHNPGLPWHQSPESSQRDMNQASSASLGSSSINMPLESSSFPFTIPTQRDHMTLYSNSRSLQNSVSNVTESASRGDFISSSEIMTSPDNNNMQEWSAPSAVSVHPTHLNSNSYQQLSGNTERDAHESSGAVTDLQTAPNDKAHFKPLTWSPEAQTIGDPTVSSTIKSPVLNQHEESILTTTNEKTDTTENAVDARKNSNAPNVNLIKPPKRMFSRKGKCLSGLFRKAPQGFPHVSFDYEIYCFLCCRMAAGNNVYEHMFFGNLKCIECGHVVRSCEDFKIVRHSSVECGDSKRKHRLASWADCPVEFLVYSVKQSLVPNRLEDCSPPSTSDVTTEMRNYMEKLSLLRFYKPWRSAFRRCSEYVKSMNRTERDSVLPEDTQKVIKREVVDSVIPGDTEEEIIKEKVSSDILGDAQEEINKEEANNDMQKDTHKEMSRQEIGRDTGRTTFYDLISSQSERQEEPQMEGISINEALEQYQENSQTTANNTLIVHPSTSNRVITGSNQEAQESTSNLQMFENILQDDDKDAHDNDNSQVSNDQFEDGDTTSTYTQDPIRDTQQHSPLWEPNGDDTHESMVEETETCKSFQDERKSENQIYERSFELSERLSTSSPEPEDNQVVYYYPSETPPEECPMCYYTLCATMFTLNTINFRVSTKCPDCSLKICIVLKDSANPR